MVCSALKDLLQQVDLALSPLITTTVVSFGPKGPPTGVFLSFVGAAGDRRSLAAKVGLFGPKGPPTVQRFAFVGAAGDRRSLAAKAGLFGPEGPPTLGEDVFIYINQAGATR